MQSQEGSMHENSTAKFIGVQITSSYILHTKTCSSISDCMYKSI